MKYLLALAALLLSFNANAAPVFIDESSCNTNSCTFDVYLGEKGRPLEGIYPYVEIHYINFTLDRAATYSLSNITQLGVNHMDTIIDNYALWGDSWKGPAPKILEAGLHTFGMMWVQEATGSNLSRTINFQYLSEVPAPAPLFLMIPALAGFSLLRTKTSR